MTNQQKYLSFILTILVGIAVVVFAVSQFFVSGDTPESMGEIESVVGNPSTTLPTSPPYVDPPTSPPPGL